MKYEYKEIRVKATEKLTTLNKEGAEGWRPVDFRYSGTANEFDWSIVDITFERPIRDVTPASEG